MCIIKADANAKIIYHINCSLTMMIFIIMTTTTTHLNQLP